MTKNYLFVAINLYIFLMLIIFLVKPKIIFHKNGTAKQFGLGQPDKTILPIWFVSIFGAIFSYMISLIFNQQESTNQGYQLSNDDTPVRNSNYQWGVKNNYQEGGNLDHRYYHTNGDMNRMYDNRKPEASRRVNYDSHLNNSFNSYNMTGGGYQPYNTKFEGHSNFLQKDMIDWNKQW